MSQMGKIIWYGTTTDLDSPLDFQKAKNTSSGLQDMHSDS